VTDVEIRAARDRDAYADFSAVEEVVQPDNVHGVEELLTRQERFPDSLNAVARRGRTPLGIGSCGKSIFGAPDEAWGWIAVLPDERRQGIGAALWDRIAAHAREIDRSSMTVWVTSGDEASLAFARARGFEQIGIVRESSLDLREDRGAPAPLPDGVRITTLSELLEIDGIDRAMWEVELEAIPDTPGPQTIEAPPFEEWRRAHFEHILERPQHATVALAGDRVIGFAAIAPRGRGGTVAQNRGTSVCRDWRRRGVARAIKQAQIANARAAGIERLITQNDDSNIPMRTLNEQLGYRPMPPKLWMKGPLPS
jgi:GNAT superfamily N-acetyltransferase